MGLKAQLFEFMAAMSIYAKAFSADKTLRESKSPIAVIDDSVGGAIMTLHSKAGSRIMTGEEWFDSFYGKHYKNMVKYKAQHYVIAIDDGSRTPIQKTPEHEKRDKGAAAKWSAYPEGCIVTSAGIQHKETLKVEPMDMDRVVVDRRIRRSLFQFFLARLALSRPPPGVRLYVDHEASGPTMFELGKEPVKLTKLRHMFGEADMMIPVWCRFFRSTCDVIIRSIDGDLGIIMLNYIDIVPRADRRFNLLWKRKPDEPLIDLKLLRQMLGERLMMITAMSILLGTDYHIKKGCIWRVGDEPLLKWVLNPEKQPIFTTWRGWDLTQLLKHQPSLWAPADKRGPWERTYIDTLLLPETEDKKEETKKPVLFQEEDDMWASLGLVGKSKAPKKIDGKETDDDAVVMLYQIVSTAIREVSKPTATIKDHFKMEGARTWAFAVHYWRFNWKVIQQNCEDYK